MKQEDVLDLLELFAQNDIEVFVDGGWGVDALLGEQTREHSDLDVALRHKYVPILRELLDRRGYKPVPRNDTKEYNFVLGDEQGRQVDIHSYELDDDGNNIFGVEYIADHLTGTGSIGGKIVKTIDPVWMVKFHSGYELDEDDYHDVRLLCEKYSIPLPTEYKKFE